jgi:hypothetical protein
MADVGAPVGEVLTSAVVAMAVGGVLGGLAETWWQRRRGERTPYEQDVDGAADTEDTVRL